MKILGLDLGTASVGWSLVEDDQDVQRLLGMGVRSFQEPIVPKTKESKNASRRAARLLRRNTERRAMRKRELKRILETHQMCPAENIDAWISLDPYILRQRALSEKLTITEIGRALYHLGQRRGFLSNRKSKGFELTDFPEVNELIRLDEEADLNQAKSNTKKSDENSMMLSEIATLRDQIESSGCRTLGEFFQKKLTSGERIRSKHTLREMFKHEFEAIWEKQKSFYPNKLNDALKAQLYKIIFFQRPLKDQSHLRSQCTLEPGKPVTLRSHHIFQEFRILCELRNIRLISVHSGKEIPLSDEEVDKCLAKLSETAKLTFTQMRALLGLPKKDKLMINLEVSNPKGFLEGNKTNVALNATTNGQWSDWDEVRKSQVIETIITQGTDLTKLNQLISSVGIHPEQAYKILTTPLVDGTASYSLKAIKKMIPHLKSGCDKHRAQVEAGYEGMQWPDHTTDKLNWHDIPEARNPGVNKCLHETRKVVNAIVKKYGKPDLVRIEMGRDLALPKDVRYEIENANKKNQAANEEAVQFATENGVKKPKRADVIKYKLWKECDGICPYTGKSIPLSELWGSNWDIEHIIPFSISFDDSFSNKTLCDADFNRNVKRNRIPSEIYSQDNPRWAEMLSRVDSLQTGRHKKKLFAISKSDLPEDFVSRQLNDTRYASRLVRDYVAHLGVSVESSTGKHTSILRKHWGLHNILDVDGQKNREDHRHHAIDALVVALTSRAYVKRVCDLYKNGGSLEHSPHKVPLPWESLRADTLSAVNKIVVTHEPSMRVRGALHEETGYGLNSKGMFTTRKSLSQLTQGEIERIVDDSLKAKVLEHIYRTEGKLEEKLATFRVVDRNGVSHEVQRVKLYARGQTKDRYFKTRRGYFPSGSNQWLLITESNETGVRDAIVVPLWKAVEISRAKIPVESLVPDGQRLIMCLQKNDMVEIKLAHSTEYYRVSGIAVENPVDLHLHHHAFAQSQERNSKPKDSIVRIRSRKDLPLILKRLTVGMIDVR